MGDRRLPVTVALPFSSPGHPIRPYWLSASPSAGPARDSTASLSSRAASPRSAGLSFGARLRGRLGRKGSASALSLARAVTNAPA